jgi:hypothetical protein
MNNRVMWQVNKERHDELLQVAGDRRLVTKSQTERLSRLANLSIGTGELFISLGVKIKARYPAVTTSIPAQTPK